MLSAVVKNGALILTLLLTVAVYFGRTVPAQFRNRVLHDQESRSIREVERLREEAQRWTLQKQALVERDPATLSRIVTARWTQGNAGLSTPASENDSAETPTPSGTEPSRSDPSSSDPSSSEPSRSDPSTSDSHESVDPTNSKIESSGHTGQR